MYLTPLPRALRSCVGVCLKRPTILIASLLFANLTTSPLAAQSNETTSSDAPSSMQEVYQDWVVTCRKNTDASKPQESHCQMAQELRNQKTGQLILSLVLPAKQLPDGANAVVIAPFGLDLSKGVTLSMLEQVPSDDKNNQSGFTARAVDPKQQAAFRTCVPSGCLSNFTLSDEMKGAFRARTRALVSMVSIDQDRVINVPLSLRGFTAAERRLAALKDELD